MEEAGLVLFKALLQNIAQHFRNTSAASPSPPLTFRGEPKLIGGGGYLFVLMLRRENIEGKGLGVEDRQMD